MPVTGSTVTRILCVDDNQDVSDTHTMLLNACGFDALACYDGFNALRLAGEALPDLCFIDLNMPGMEGDELAIRLRKLAADRPITLVAVTAMNREEDIRRVRAAGFTGHLVKPADPMTLVRLAREAVKSGLAG